MTRKFVILDSGFCVLLALIALKKIEGLSAALIKKRRYWPRYVKGEEIKAHLEDAPVGDSQILSGKINGVNFDLFCVKYPDYVMTLISTYGSLQTHSNQKESVRTDDKGKLLKTFKYTEVIANHYNYHGAVDEKTAYRNDCGTKHGLSLEETRKTTRWVNCVFAFILAVSEVNAYLAIRYFGELKMTQLEFRKNRAFELIHNTLDSGTDEERTERRRNTRQNTLHKITTAPPNSGFEGGKWVKKYKQKYQQHKYDTPGYPNFIRTVCNFTKYIFRCNSCFMIRSMDSESCDSDFY